MPKVHGTAVVSRALSIIGSAYADHLATSGYDLVLIDHVRPHLNALAEELTTRTRRAVEVVVVDRESIVDLASVKAKIEEDASVLLVVNVVDESGYTLLSVDQTSALIDSIGQSYTITCTALRKFSSKSAGVSVCGAGVLITAAGHIADFPRLI